MRETTNETRVWCDGCSFACLEAQSAYIDRAIVESGWIVRERYGRQEELCPLCRPDSPFDVVDRVREVVSRGFDVTDSGASDFDAGYARALAHVLRALDSSPEEHAADELTVLTEQMGEFYD